MSDLTTRYVALYLIDKAYGGPAEGGWWYEYGILQYKLAVEGAEEVETAWAALQEIADIENEKRNSDIGQTNSDGRYEVLRYDNEPLNFPSEKPHYE